jgi:hypothetical protein
MSQPPSHPSSPSPSPARELVFQVLGPGDFDEVYQYSDLNHTRAVPDEVERRFQSWTARWRKEELEHYLKLGWSFIARDKTGRPDPADKGEMVGYFLGQPLLFFRGQTQSLWIEHMEAADISVREALVDVAVRVAREKHLQRVLFGNGGVAGSAEQELLASSLSRWANVPLGEQILEVKTTKG